MRIVFQRLALVAAVALAACSDRSTLAPSEPSTGTPSPQRSFTPSSGCELKPAQAIKDELHILIVNTPTSLWPNEQSTFGKINYIDALRSYSGLGEADSLNKAILKTKELIAFITNKYENISGSPEHNPTNTALLNTIIADLYCFVGVSGIFDLNPGDPAKSFEIPGVGGVWFPANVVPTGTIVVLTALDPSIPVLNTVLDQYGSYLEVHLIPEQAFSEPNLPILVICPVLADGTPVSGDLLANLQIGHEASTGFELLEPAEYPGPNPCPDVGAGTAPRGWLNGWLARAVDLVLPSQAHAAPMFLVIGLGGRSGGFSTFGATNYTTSAIGVGGRSTGFTPPAANSPASSGPAFIPPATTSWDGIAGSSRATDLPSVTVTTPGGDNIPPGTDGKNPIVGATVTFSIGATANTSDTDSDAKFCTGLTQATVPTNASGVASVPCIAFGTKAGFANLAAAIDVSTAPALLFPGADQIVVNVSDNNFLIETTPAAATKIVTYIGGTASPSYSYGTAFAEGAAVLPPPKVLVTDQYDNRVGAGIGIVWSPTEDANGAVLVPGLLGTATDAQSEATAASWTLGAGAHILTATIAGAADPPSTATFTASTPTGVEVFACAVGGSKTDIGWMNIPKPSGTMREITLYMSVTGQSSSETTYPATIEVRKDSRTNPIIGSGAGGVTLPGNNGSPRAVTLRLSDPVTTAEIGNGNPTFYIFVGFPGISPTRKMQVWYSSSVANNSPCSKSLVYAPGSTTSFKKGLGIKVTN